MISKYLSPTVTNIIAGFLILVIIGIVFLFFKGPKYKGKLNYQEKYINCYMCMGFSFPFNKSCLRI